MGIVHGDAVAGQHVDNPLRHEAAAEPVVKADHRAPLLHLAETVHTQGRGQGIVLVQAAVHGNDGLGHQSHGVQGEILADDPPPAGGAKGELLARRIGVGPDFILHQGICFGDGLACLAEVMGIRNGAVFKPHQFFDEAEIVAGCMVVRREMFIKKAFDVLLDHRETFGLLEEGKE